MKELEPLKIYKVIDLQNFVLLPLGLIVIGFFVFYGYVSQNPFVLIAVLGGLFGGYFFILIRILNTKQNKPVLTIDYDGVRYKDYNIIPWDYIITIKSKINFWSKRDRNKVIIELKNEHSVVIVTDELDHTLEEILDKIKAYQPTQLP